MGQISYKTIIQNSINHFNSIQDVLSTKNAKYNGAQITLTTDENRVLVPTATLSTIINDQLQLKAAGTFTVTSAGSFDVTYKETVAVSSGALEGLSGEYDSTLKKYVVSGGVKTAGWVSTETDQVGHEIGLASITFEDGQIKVLNPGYMPADGDAGEILPDIPDGELSATAGVKSTTIAASSVSFINKPGSGTEGTDYFELIPSAIATASANVKTAGYVDDETASSETNSISKASYYLAKSKLSQGTIGSFSFTPVVSNKSETDGTSGNIKLAGTNAQSFTTTVPESGHFLSISTSGVTNNNITSQVNASQGYTNGDSLNASFNASVSSTSYYIKVKSGSVDVKSGEEVKVESLKPSTSFDDGGSILTLSHSDKQTIKLSKTNGYIDSEEVSSSEVSKSASLTVDLKTLSTTLIPENIRKDVVIFGVTGTLEAGSMLPDLDKDALAPHILDGFKAYNELGQVIVGTMPNLVGQNVANLASVSLTNSDGVYSIKALAKQDGYIDTTSYTEVVVPTESKDATVSDSNYSTGQAISPVSGKLLKEVKILPISDATFSGGTLTPTYTENDKTISNSVNIYEYAEINPDTVSGFIYQFKVVGSKAGKTATSGWSVQGTETGLISIDETVSIKIDALGVKDEFAGNDYEVVNTSGFAQSLKIKKGTHTTSVSASIEENTTKATASGDAAKINKNASTYVEVYANANATCTVTDGWIKSTEGKDVDATEVSAKIAASVNTGLSSAKVSVSASGEVGTTTLFDDTTAVKTAGAKSGTISGSNTSTKSVSSLADTYIIGNITVDGSADATITASIADTATGSDVDDCVQALLQRMLGIDYVMPE